MYLVALAWSYVILLMAVVEGTSTHGTWLGAFFTVLLYGVLPLSIVLYVMNTPHRKRARREAEAREASASAAALQPDGGHHAAGDAVTPKREEA